MHFGRHHGVPPSLLAVRSELSLSPRKFFLAQMELGSAQTVVGGVPRPHERSISQSGAPWGARSKCMTLAGCLPTAAKLCLWTWLWAGARTCTRGETG